MKPVAKLCAMLAAAGSLLAVISCSVAHRPAPTPAADLQPLQTPQWSAADRDFFLHGSMSAEFVPEVVLRTFIALYPDLFPSADLSNLGLLPDPAFGWPVGFSRARPAHLAGLSSVGVNCAACHVGRVDAPRGLSAGPVVVMGMTSHFDAEGFFGAVLGATFRTSDAPAMRRFLAEYLDQSDPEPDAARRARRQEKFAEQWGRQALKIEAAIAADPTGATGAGPGGLQEINPADLRLDSARLESGVDLAALSTSMLRLFHNMRTSLHFPDTPPASAPPPSGPGRNDAFGLLSAILFSDPRPYSPVKFGLLWDLKDRRWVHWDGNTQSPIGRNLLASLGLGAPLVGDEGRLDFAAVQRQTALSQEIVPPRYPYTIDPAAAARGRTIYETNCASCHNGPEDDRRLHSPQDIGTDSARANLFAPAQAEKFNHFLATLRAPGYTPPAEPSLRSTGKYWAASLGGVWARSPYLHNGSVRTMTDLLTPARQRPATFHRGSHIYDDADMGYTDAGPYQFDARTPGNSSAGHEYGTGLTEAQKADLIEYLKGL